MAHVIVNCNDYNGYKNVLFMMKTDDFRYKNQREWGYQHVHSGKYDRKTRTFTAENGKLFNVYSDWSIKEVK